MEAVLLIAVLIFSVVVHEVAHAWQARREGDDTADRLGRITLNPRPHLDPIGSVIVPLVLHFSGSGFLFGWARPVPVNPANYRSPVWGDIRVSMAGIVSNLGLAVLSTFALAIALKAQSALGPLGGTTAVAARPRTMAFSSISCSRSSIWFQSRPWTARTCSSICCRNRWRCGTGRRDATGCSS